VPELPEIETLAGFLSNRCAGRSVARAELVAFACLKTTTMPSALVGRSIESVRRRGKFLCLDAGELTLVTHLAHAGWLVWRDDMPGAPARPGRGPLALRVVLDDGAGFDLTEAGTRKNLAVYIVKDASEVPFLATLGPEPLAAGLTPNVLDGILDAAGGAQIKGVLRDQRNIAGIGNAYSDEILWAARLSPFAAAARLDAHQRRTLYGAIRDVLTSAISDLDGLDARDLKPHKKAGMNVHGRTGEPCPSCSTAIAEVSFADSSMQYCPTCQTGGKVLADRRLSRLLK